MEVRDYITPGPKSEYGDISNHGYRYLQRLAELVNALYTMQQDLPTYANNAAAVAAGLSTGDWYYDSTLTGVRIVT